eukprot:TRINITY_DN5190_c0_g1_i1.p1 TRINITY_DN5190_c0_g1~~TRINITY_DN5190_c0_g1_i1.p1  ORF type:complete len:398 (+),score=80.25 TRINITY_DN5190_c0_g1_i1:166-1359(+)
MALDVRGYEVVSELGRGSFGAALLVKHKRCRVRLTAKMINLTGMDRRDVTLTRNEVAILASLDHPNITKFVEAFEEGPEVYIVMEHADGGDLADRIALQRSRGVHFDEPTVSAYLVQLCFALRHLHKRRILHRDLKTRNVFLTKLDVVKLGDFGVARRLGAVGLAKSICGTPYYFAPEMCRDEPYSAKCDVWACGVILYELLCLRKPVYGDTPEELLELLADPQFEPVPANGLYSQELLDVCHSMLTVDPRKRPHVHQLMGTMHMQRELAAFAERLRGRGAGRRPHAERQSSPARASRGDSGGTELQQLAAMATAPLSPWSPAVDADSPSPLSPGALSPCALADCSPPAAASPCQEAPPAAPEDWADDAPLRRSEASGGSRPHRQPAPACPGCCTVS